MNVDKRFVGFTLAVSRRVSLPSYTKRTEIIPSVLAPTPAPAPAGVAPGVVGVVGVIGCLGTVGDMDVFRTWASGVGCPFEDAITTSGDLIVATDGTAVSVASSGGLSFGGDVTVIVTVAADEIGTAAMATVSDDFEATLMTSAFSVVVDDAGAGPVGSGGGGKLVGASTGWGNDAEDSDSLDVERFTTSVDGFSSETVCVTAVGAAAAAIAAVASGAVAGCCDGCADLASAASKAFFQVLKSRGTGYDPALINWRTLS
jgi:hypothetical protein